MRHVTHVEHLPYVGRNIVHCDQGCYLGDSAVQPTFDKALRRAELHEFAQNFGHPDAAQLPATAVTVDVETTV